MTRKPRSAKSAHLFAPHDAIATQDKLALTGFEHEVGSIVPGDALEVFELAPGRRVAISVCYDIEFPLPVRAQVEAGARLVVVPSCTDTPAGIATEFDTRPSPPAHYVGNQQR